MKNEIIKILQETFSPSQLEVHDDSQYHIGHAGAKEGGGHFTICISADCFRHLSRIEAHQKIYALFKNDIPKKIHALSIKIIKN